MHAAMLKLNWLCAALLQREKGKFHGVAVVPPWRIDRADCEEFKLPAVSHVSAMIQRLGGSGTQHFVDNRPKSCGRVRAIANKAFVLLRTLGSCYREQKLLILLLIQIVTGP